MEMLPNTEKHFNKAELYCEMCRSSRPEVFFKKGVFRNFTKFNEKHLCQSLFFNQAAGRPGTLLKKRLWHRCFPVNFEKFSRTPFCIKHLWWLLLNVLRTINSLVLGVHSHVIHAETNMQFSATGLFKYV